MRGKSGRGKEDLRISLLGTAILVTLTLAAGASTYLVMQSQARALLKKNVGALLQDDARFFDQEIGQRTREAVIVATRPFTRRDLERLDTHAGDQRARRRLLAVARSYLPVGFTAVVYYDARGHCVAQAGHLENPPFVVPLRTTYETFLLWRKRPMLETALPIKKNGRLIGSLVTQAPLSFIATMRPVVGALGRTADLSVCAAVGPTYMRCLADTRHLQYVPGELPRSIHGRTLPVSFALRGKTGFAYTRSRGGAPIAAAYTPVRHTGLGMVLSIRQSELFRGLHKRLFEVTALLVSLLSLGIMMMMWLVVPLLRRRTEAEEKTIAANTELQNSQAQIQGLLAHMAEGVIVIDEQGTIEMFNAAAEQIFGYAPADIIGQNVSRLMPEPYRSEHDGYLRRYLETGQSRVVGVSREVTGVRFDGGEFPLQTKIREVRTDTKRLFIAAVRDITLEREASRRTLYLATHDALTGLPNRLLLGERLQQGISQARSSQNRLALLFLDLDNFKTINDSLGHDIGDLLLKAFAQRLKKSLRGDDTVARLGGDEFVAILAGPATTEGVRAAVDKVLASTKTPYRLQGHTLHVGTSIGVAIFPDDGEDSGTLMKRGDIAMYRAKEAGGDTHAFFDSGYAPTASLGAQLRDAWARAACELYYRPVYGLASGRITALETVLCWRQPSTGILNQADLPVLSDDPGLGAEILQWTLATACRQWKSWANEKALQPPPLHIKLSALQLPNVALETHIERTLKDCGMPTESLVLETSETMITGTRENLNRLHILHALGLPIAIDCLKVELSDVGRLKNLPVSILKLDHSFARAAAAHADDAEVAHTIITLAHKLRWVVVAQGVETEEQYSALRVLRCDQYQDENEPLPSDQIEAILAAPRTPSPENLPPET